MRILPAWNSPLRDWQRRACETVRTHQKTDFLATATPAAGKTRFALRVAHEFLKTGRALRLLVVCPTSHLRRQWADAAGAVGLQLDPALTNERAWEASDYHGAAVTYQHVCSSPETVRRGCLAKPTLVILDELHHAGDGKQWGRALKTALEPAVFRLILSGTPFRSDNDAIPFVRYVQGESQPDFSYGYSEALCDGVCRPILFPSYEGELTWVSKGREHTATFEDGLPIDRRRERLKTALLQESWLGSVIADAHEQLVRVRREEQPDAGGLIVTMDQDHARWVTDLVGRVTGGRAAVAVSDDPQASGVIDTFAGDRRQQWLVAVNMVSEGVDIPRLRVGVYGTNVLTEMYFRQVVGRFVRMQDHVPKPQRAWLYLPKDPILAHYAWRIKEERDHVLEDIPLAGQRDLFGRVTVSTNEYRPLMAVARMDKVIGEEDVERSSRSAIAVAQPVALHELKQELRDLHRLLVAAVARLSGVDHRRLNAELIARTGSRIDQATVEQLRKRIRLLEQWRDHGYDGKR
ncbi:MAG: DEAD/DEAH box helicase family protein [Nitrospira sp.]|nr:DEAD/DEAH box helicase family protein [Nitrospira sp.]MCP9441506.1 DEAD/DEAH box helicase family protein [Nitrospira sp.]